MISETTGAWMIVAGVVLGVISWIGLRVALRHERAERIWKAWKAVARDKPWPNDFEGNRGTVYDMGTGRQVAP
ncbi:MAG: hypothetical protein WCR06_12015 [bacterium]